MAVVDRPRTTPGRGTVGALVAELEAPSPMDAPVETPDRAGPSDRADPRRADDADDPERERYRELLEELRTVQPGVQVLFAFLLMVPFNQRFESLDALGTDLYGIALAASALATASFIAPPWYHRLDGDQSRRRRLHRSVAYQVAGLAFLFVAMTSALTLVARFIYGPSPAVLIAGLFVGAAATAWWVVPAVDRARHRDGPARGRSWGG